MDNHLNTFDMQRKLQYEQVSFIFRTLSMRAAIFVSVTDNSHVESGCNVHIAAVYRVNGLAGTSTSAMEKRGNV